MGHRGLFLFCLMLWATAGWSGSITVRVDAAGRLVYTNRPVAARSQPASPYIKIRARRWTPFRHTVMNLSRKYGVDPYLVLAVIAVESDFQHQAVSRAGAIGLMQLLPETARRYQVDPWDPYQNLYGGIRHLSYLLRRYRQLELALAAYNAGERAVEKYRGVPPYPETQRYVKKVLQLYRQRPRYGYLYRDRRGVIHFTYYRPRDPQARLIKRVQLSP